MYNFQNNNENETEIPYDEEDFVDAESIATRMKAMGHLSSIADLDVDNIEYVRPLVFHTHFSFSLLSSYMLSYKWVWARKDQKDGFLFERNNLTYL